MVIDRLEIEKLDFDLNDYWGMCHGLTRTQMHRKLFDDVAHFRGENQRLKELVDGFSPELGRGKVMSCIAESAAALALRQAEIDLVVVNKGSELIRRLEISNGSVSD
jgi:hypothetical protein